MLLDGEREKGWHVTPHGENALCSLVLPAEYDRFEQWVKQW